MDSGEKRCKGEDCRIDHVDSEEEDHKREIDQIHRKGQQGGEEAKNLNIGGEQLIQQEIEVGDEAIVTYAGINYKYKITNIYKQKNTGTVSIKRNYDKTTLTLITCTKDDSSTQTIYIAELDSVE